MRPVGGRVVVLADSAADEVGCPVEQERYLEFSAVHVLGAAALQGSLCAGLCAVFVDREEGDAWVEADPLEWTP